MELHQTQIANELRIAARHEEGHRLVGVCRHLAAYHKIVGTVKEKYAGYFTDKVRNELAGVKLRQQRGPSHISNDISAAFPKKSLNRRSDWSWVRDDIL